MRGSERLYQVMCQAQLRPVKIADLHRMALAQRDVSWYENALTTANIQTPRDPRLCWAGQGLYGLARDGLIAGPRDLASVAVLVILVADRALTAEELEFVMKRMGYRFELGSLINALRRYDWFDEWMWRRWDVARGPRIQHRYRDAIDARWPARRFDEDMERLGSRVRLLLDERTRLQYALPDLSHLDDDWAPRQSGGGR